MVVGMQEEIQVVAMELLDAKKDIFHVTSYTVASPYTRLPTPKDKCTSTAGHIETMLFYSQNTVHSATVHSRHCFFTT